MRDFISKTTASGGGDEPEDVAGGLRKCLDQNWTPGSKRQVFHIFDAPCHGTKYHDCSWDNHKNGDPTGLVMEDLMAEFYQKQISFTCIKLNDRSDKMIKMMKENHPDLQVTDMAEAVKGKSSVEVDKMFVDSACVILRDKVGGKDLAGKKRTTKNKGKPKWNPKKLEVSDIFSNITYLQVKKIEGNMVHVANHSGGSWIISKQLLSRDMNSADHFDKEIKCSMSELSIILQSCGDCIFKVKFKKKVDEKDIIDKLKGVKVKDLQAATKLKQISKEILDGEEKEITCRHYEIEDNMGRSIVVDLDAIHTNNIRSVDHRTIDYIIFRNVKYTLGKKATADKDLELPLPYPKNAVV